MNRLSAFFNRFKKSEIQTGGLKAQTSPLNADVEALQAQLHVSAELARLAAETAGDHVLMKEISDVLQQRCLLHYVGVFLVDQAREYAVLQYGTGDQGRQMVSASYRLAAGGYSLVGRCIQAREKISSIVDPSTPAHFENPFLPQSRSELALPLIKNDQLMGVLDVHSAVAKPLEEATVNLLMLAADLLAVSLLKLVLADKMSKTSVFLNLDTLEKPVQQESKEISVTFSNPGYTKPRLKDSKQSIPLMVGLETIGNLDLEMDDQEWSEEQEHFAKAVAAQALSAIENTRQLDQIRHHAEHERKILEITSKIRSTNDSQQMLQIALEEISSHLGVTQAQIVLNVPEVPKNATTFETNTKSLQNKLTTGQLPEL